MTTAIIAQHLNIAESAIIKVESWANTLFVVAKGLGARFVSKSVVKTDWQNDPRYGFAEELESTNPDREERLMVEIGWMVDRDTKKSTSKWTTWELNGEYYPRNIKASLADAKAAGFTVFYNQNQAIVGVLAEQI